MSNEQIENRVKFILNTEAGKNLTVSQIVALYKEVEDMFAPKPQPTNSKGVEYLSLEEVKALVEKHPMSEADTHNAKEKEHKGKVYSRITGEWLKSFGTHLAANRVRRKDYITACGFSEDYKLSPQTMRDAQRDRRKGKPLGRPKKGTPPHGGKLINEGDEQAVG